jgi:hypothetical protein
MKKQTLDSVAAKAATLGNERFFLTLVPARHAIGKLFQACNSYKIFHNVCCCLLFAGILRMLLRNEKKKLICHFNFEQKEN